MDNYVIYLVSVLFSASLKGSYSPGSIPLLRCCRLISKVGLLAEFMVSMMSVKGDTTLNYGKHSLTALTVCQ